MDLIEARAAAAAIAGRVVAKAQSEGFGVDEDRTARKIVEIAGPLSEWIFRGTKPSV